MFGKRMFSLLFSTGFCLFCLFFLSCRGGSRESLLIITEAQAGISDTDHNRKDAWRNMPGTRIISVNPDKPEKVKILTGDFYSVGSPDISYDGRYMLFAARQKEGESWQIWEMDLKKLRKRKITAFAEDCADPMYLPANRFVFSKMTYNDTVVTGYALHTGNLDGTNINQVTYHPNVNLATTVLKDGRFLSVSKSLQPGSSGSMLMVMRPDGTKADLFYMGMNGSALLSRPREDTNGRIFFIESEDGRYENGNVISISYNRPLHSRINLSEGSGTSYRYVLPVSGDRLLVSSRTKDDDHYSLREFDPVAHAPGKTVYDNPGYDVVEAVLAEAYQRPKKLPSEVDMGKNTGLLMCQDINILRTPPSDDPRQLLKAVKVEIIGIDSSLGIVEVEKDGSFYLKITADMPFRIQTLDEHNRVINGTCAWMWLRPNERRGCVGCHEDPERVPDNIVPLAVKKSPAAIPVSVSDIIEKEIELE